MSSVPNLERLKEMNLEQVVGIIENETNPQMGLQVVQEVLLDKLYDVAEKLLEREDRAFSVKERIALAKGMAAGLCFEEVAGPDQLIKVLEMMSGSVASDLSPDEQELKRQKWQSMIDLVRSEQPILA